MLTVIAGPMFAGKTSALISTCMSHIVAGNKVVAYKPAKDNRYDDKFIVSHNLDKFACVPVERASTILTHSQQHRPDVVAIDEAQFFDTKELVDLIWDLIYLHRDVICAGLAQDYMGDPFGAMPQLLSMADEIISLKAVCSKCKGIGLASRTYRKPGEALGQLLVGGADKYEARCFKCWVQ
jgi:thymidine kinase